MLAQSGKKRNDRTVYFCPARRGYSEAEIRRCKRRDDSKNYCRRFKRGKRIFRFHLRNAVIYYIRIVYVGKISQGKSVFRPENEVCAVFGIHRKGYFHSRGIDNSNAAVVYFRNEIFTRRENVAGIERFSELYARLVAALLVELYYIVDVRYYGNKIFACRYGRNLLLRVGDFDGFRSVIFHYFASVRIKQLVAAKSRARNLSRRLRNKLLVSAFGVESINSVFRSSCTESRSQIYGFAVFGHD